VLFGFLFACSRPLTEARRGYLHADDTVADAKAGIGSWISFYDVSRPHSPKQTTS
jgi:hypothetical protein